MFANNNHCCCTVDIPASENSCCLFSVNIKAILIDIQNLIYKI